MKQKKNQNGQHRTNGQTMNGAYLDAESKAKGPLRRKGGGVQGARPQR